MNEQTENLNETGPKVDQTEKNNDSVAPKIKEASDLETQYFYNVIYQNNIRDKKQLALINDMIKKKAGGTAGLLFGLTFVASLFMPWVFEKYADKIPVHPMLISLGIVFLFSLLLTAIGFASNSGLKNAHECKECFGVLAFWFDRAIIKKEEPKEDHKLFKTDCSFETKHIKNTYQLQHHFDVWKCIKCGHETEQHKKDKNVLLKSVTYWTCDRCGKVNTIQLIDKQRREKKRYTERHNKEGEYGSCGTQNYHHEWIECEEYVEYEIVERYRCSHCGGESVERFDDGKERVNTWQENRRKVIDRY